jgi:hypothetical protein
MKDDGAVERKVSAVDERILYDGTRIPQGEAAAILQAFDVRFPFGEPRARGVPLLLDRLMAARQGRALETEVLQLLGQLAADRLVREAPNPGPSIRGPKLPNLPGIPKNTDCYAPDDPRPGERCFAATPTGTKAARYLTTEQLPQVPWKLGADRATDQVILACDPAPQALWAIDAACSLLEPDATKRALAEAERQGFLLKGTKDVWGATAQGRGRAHELRRELSDRWAASIRQPLPSVAQTPLDPLRDPSLLAFIRDAKLGALIRRDLLELADAATRQGHKSVLLLCGSVLEASLLDALDRNAGLAASLLPKGKKHWPDDASLPILLEIAKTKVRLPDGTEASILSPTVVPLAHGLADHRDLIHPRAEIRDRIRVDQTTAETMLHFVRVVLRDLQHAATTGVLDAYARGDTV